MPEIVHDIDCESDGLFPSQPVQEEAGEIAEEEAEGADPPPEAAGAAPHCAHCANPMAKTQLSAISR